MTDDEKTQNEQALASPATPSAPDTPTANAAPIADGNSADLDTEKCPNCGAANEPDPYPPFIRYCRACGHRTIAPGQENKDAQ